MSRRLILAMAGLVAIVTAALAIPLALVVDTDQRAAFIAGLERDTLITASILGSQPERMWQATAIEESRRTGARVIVVDQERQLVADSDNTDLDRTFDRPEVNEALAGKLSSDVRFSTTLGEDLRFVAAPVIQNLAVAAAVRLTLPEGEVDALVARTRLGLLGFCLAIVVAAGMIAWVVAASMASPLTKVAKVAEGLSDDLTLRASERRGPPEVRSVARALNHTAERLAGFIRRQQQVAADASHHLKTPLTSIRLRLEAIEDTTSNDEVRGDAEAALSEVDRLTRRIDHVLTLARTEAGQDSIVVDPIAVVREREQSFLGPVHDRGLALVIEEGAGITPMLAPAGSLERVLDELVGNALQYARTRITISVGRVGSAVSVAVSDDGPGLDPSEWSSVFERFQRGSKAVPGGSGLGLALVRELAQAAGGDAVAGRSAAGGLVITTTWPPSDTWPGATPVMSTDRSRAL